MTIRCHIVSHSLAKSFTFYLKISYTVAVLLAISFSVSLLFGAELDATVVYEMLLRKVSITIFLYCNCLDYYLILCTFDFLFSSLFISFPPSTPLATDINTSMAMNNTLIYPRYECRA